MTEPLMEEPPESKAIRLMRAVIRTLDVILNNKMILIILKGAVGSVMMWFLFMEWIVRSAKIILGIDEANANPFRA